MSRKPKKYHYIYKTTCKITGKFYVGMHSTNNLEDGYLGSGKILGYSRKKYGDENHVREILEMCSSRDELKQREKEIVNEALLADPLNINLKYGGEGGWDHLNDGSQLQKQRLAKAGKIGALSPKRDKKKISKKAFSTMIERGTVQFGGRNGSRFTGKSYSIESSEKRKQTFTSRNHQKGETNSQFGTCWVTRDGTPRKIKKTQLQEYLKEGYLPGRKTCHE